MYSFSLLNKTKSLTVILGLCLLAAIGGYFFRPMPAQKRDVLFRMSQWPLTPGDPHSVLILSRPSLDPIQVELAGAGRIVRLDIQKKAPLAAWNLSTVDMPPLEAGAYRLQTLDQKWQHDFVVDRVSADPILKATLDFFGEQRCGIQTHTHGACHLKMPKLESGKDADRDLSGGWHDAGDYIRFFLTSSYATTLMLESLQWLEPRQKKLVITEAGWGLRWLDKMWGGKDNSKIIQIGDISDHDRWRLPVVDDQAAYFQTAYAMSPSRGANLAGRLVSSMALYSQVCAADEKSYWLERAVEIFTQAQLLSEGAQSSLNNFYQEKSWQDDMALAALELWAVTKQEIYLAQAEKYFKKMEPFWAFGYDQIHPLVYLRWAQLVPEKRALAIEQMRQVLERNLQDAQQSPFKLSPKKFFWGSQLEVMGTGILALIFEKVSGDSQFRTLAIEHWDYTLGKNPWGLSLVSGIGREWLETPHHQISDLGKIPLKGYWAPGPVHQEIWEKQKIAIDRKSQALAPFSTETLLQFSDSRDYVTNEPTLTAAATGLIFTAIFFAK